MISRNKPALMVIGLFLAGNLLLSACGGATPSSSLPATSATLQPGGPPAPPVAFTWQRTGGIVALCNQLVVSPEGQVTAKSCDRGASKPIGQTQLSQKQLELLKQWLDTFKPFEVDLPNQSVSNRLLVHIVFNGQGESPVTLNDQLAIANLAARLYAHINNQQSD